MHSYQFGFDVQGMFALHDAFVAQLYALAVCDEPQRVQQSNKNADGTMRALAKARFSV